MKLQLTNYEKTISYETAYNDVNLEEYFEAFEGLLVQATFSQKNIREYIIEWGKELEKFISEAEFQQEISYSEEDMKSAYEQGSRLALLSQSPLALHKGEFPNPEEWFNDFKKENKLWKE
jgi:hypothetical protein